MNGASLFCPLGIYLYLCYAYIHCFTKVCPHMAWFGAARYQTFYLVGPQVAYDAVIDKPRTRYGSTSFQGRLMC
ncbi:hypothetical protein F5Y14DRAFT_432412 [Nemania sp. NC0429]|nr:hypothetical protein F5Y14DRAFT_432412 [Nemania sp. NC0429]